MKKLSPFEKATERYQNAQKMMFVKEQLKKELPPRGSAAYRYFSDSDKTHHHIIVLWKVLIICLSKNVKIIPLGTGIQM